MGGISSVKLNDVLGHVFKAPKWYGRVISFLLSLLQDATNVTLRSETLRETVCDAIIANDAI